MIQRGNISPKKPQMSAERAVPPTVTERIDPSIALLFSSGRASINEALNTVLPIQLRIYAIKTKMRIQRNCDELYATRFSKINPRQTPTPLLFPNFI